jgi:CRISPR system Cascade subunit CasB
MNQSVISTADSEITKPTAIIHRFIQVIDNVKNKDDPNQSDQASYSLLTKGERTALARLNPDGEWRPHHLAALCRVFVYSNCNLYGQHHWRTWALIAHGITLTGHKKGRLGGQFFDAGLSEARVTKLLTARDVAFRQAVLRLIRFTAHKSQPLNWIALGYFILNVMHEKERAEQDRIQIARDYFSATYRQQQ